MDFTENMKPAVAEHESKMNEELLQRSLDQIPKHARLFIEAVPKVDGLIKIKEFTPLSEQLLASALDGFEFFCMGEVFEYPDKWAPEYFGLTMNYLIAEYFGRGKMCTTNEWLVASERAISSLTHEGYKKYKRVTPDIIRSYLNNLMDLSVNDVTEATL